MPKKIARKILVPVVAAACALSVSACQAQTSNSDEASQETTNTAEETTEQTTRRVGKAGVGYVTVPSDWISLATKSGSGDIEFCDITATKIITMKIMDSNDVDIVNAQNTADTSTQASSTDATASTNGTESSTTSTNSTSSQSTSDSATTNSGSSSSASSDTSKSTDSTSEEAKPVTVDEAVAAVIKHAKEYDVTDDNIVKEAATLANRDAAKLTITYGDGTEVICWILTDDSGNVRYVAAEAPAESVADVASIVENTYSF